MNVLAEEIRNMMSGKTEGCEKLIGILYSNEFSFLQDKYSNTYSFVVNAIIERIQGKYSKREN